MSSISISRRLGEVARRHASKASLPPANADGLGTHFFLRHAVWPAVIFIVLFVPWTWTRADLWLADHFYAWEGHAWTWRHARITQQLIHLLGRNLSAMAWLLVFAAWLASLWQASLASLRKPLLYLLTATALSSLLVALLKTGSNMDCPWDLARYGGTRAYFGLWHARPSGMPRAGCFPAGHASAGYAWLALYFFLLAVAPKWRWAGLAIGVAAGLLFGISQQLRGAHFASHDLATAAICWFTALAAFGLFWRTPTHRRAR